jgi:Neuraminidase (sialidase)
VTRREAAAVLLAPAFAARAETARTLPFPSDVYAGWPTVARRKNGDLLLVWSGDREAHVCPFGRVLLSVSRDDGATWTYPRVLMDSDLDDRDAGVVETPRGSLLVTTFTSLAYERSANPPPHWAAARDRLKPEERKRQLGSWMLRSTDNGISWSTPYRVPFNSPHGPVPLSDGRLLYAGKDLYGETGEIGVCESSDDGVSWRILARIPARPGDDVKNYHELHGVETAPGRILAQIRNHNEANRNETLQSESTDGGKTWSVPHAIGVWGLPSHLLRLRSGRILMTYGYRRKPFGNQARVSRDAGKTWSEPITVSADGASGDLGYPSTVELADGKLLTVWYELPAGSKRAVLRQSTWSLPG